MAHITATPFKINNMELKNRIIMLVMHTGFATGGVLTEQDKAFFEERAVHLPVPDESTAKIFTISELLRAI